MYIYICLYICVHKILIAIWKSRHLGIGVQIFKSYLAEYLAKPMR